MHASYVLRDAIVEFMYHPNLQFLCWPVHQYTESPVDILFYTYQYMHVH